MELLTIHHEDFTLYVECSKYEAIWEKAVRNVGQDNLLTTYTWTDGVKSATINDEPIENGKQARAVFFDNAEYPVWVEFGSHVSKAQFGSMLQADNDRFSFRGHTLAGFINYSNDIGRSELKLVYNIGNEQRRFKLSFEVLSTKLNYHEHWKKIVEDIEAEYRMLSLDYMKRTFHGFSPDTKGDTPELIWWSIFAGEQEKFIKACRSIIERPRRRLRGYEVFMRADKLKRVPTNIENELAEHRKEQAHLYRVEEHIQSNDTQENRFLKYALNQIAAKYETLKKRIEAIKNTSESLKREMDEVEKTLTHLLRNPFFRTVGRFKGLTQESLVLQRATGYSQIYRTWQLLRRAYSLNDGMYKLQSKDIATLYEIWCFIEVSHIVKEQLGIDVDVDHRNRMEMNGVFTWELGKGEHSQILFRKDGVELAELVYNPKHTENENDSISIENIVVPTVPQKPDIVLQLTKDDIEKGMKMTYLFDAKYRINDRTTEGVDTPPDDAINQMHRYRDAIYYKDNKESEASLKKEVIGGYILFPGNGEPNEVAKAKFQQSLDEVNIGAFPLRPNDVENRKLLEEFIEKLIGMKSADTIAKVIPQKGTFMEVGDRVLIGLVKESSAKSYLKKFEDGTADLYYTGPSFPTTIALHNLHYFIPYMKNKGIRDVYEITKVRTIRASEAKQTVMETGKDDLRLAFHLKPHHKIADGYRAIDTHKMSDRTFLDTTFGELEQLYELAIFPQV
ncbi:MAG: restriction endonuclease-like protein [Paludibacteraceae bacterium]|nr:restriction endonuclease-like protein [Paludibacteraceae bacterium]